LAAGAGDAFSGSAVGESSCRISGVEPVSNGSASDYLEASFAVGDGTDATGFPWSGNGPRLSGQQFINDGLETDAAWGNISRSTSGSLANGFAVRRSCCNGSGYAVATGSAAGITDDATGCLLATDQRGEPGSTTR
jgi:hypothetical protein